MKNVFQILALILLSTIAIGDSIMTCLQTMLSVLKQLAGTTVSCLQDAGQKMLTLPRLHLPTVRSPFRVPRVKVPLKQSIIFTAKKKRKQVKKKRVGSSVFTFPLWIKLRYFVIGILFSFFFLFLPLLAMVFLQDLPHPKELTTRQIPQTTKILDRNGTLLYEIYASQNRTLVPLNNVPKHLQQATLAIEDKNFYKHPGFDVSSILRAFRENAMSNGRIMQGGSTITQQLIKSSMLSPEQSYIRKVKEIVLAFWAERLYTKEQILEMYFNQVPYGGTAWGVEAASEVYFNKNVRDLTLAESAFLAGITAAPTAYSPYSSDTNLWKRRQREVLGRMVALGYITAKEAEAAHAEKLSFNRQSIAFRAPHFVNYIKEVLVKKYGLAMVEKGGLQVVTTLDLSLQETAETIVQEEVSSATHLNLTNGAALVTDPKNGDILAMVGSKDFNDPQGGNVNLATSYRQPGSTVKVITYAAALNNGFTAASIVDDTPTTFTTDAGQPYRPVNYDGQYRGRVPFRLALANSLNLPAVKILQQVSVPKMVQLSRDMGISSWDEDGIYGLAVTLGGAEVTMLDMATVNGTLANQGKRVLLNPIKKITNYKGDILEEKKRPNSQQVLPSGVAFIISDILADNVARSLAFGPSSPLVIPGHTVSVKTGTSDHKRDNWTIGYTPDYVVTVWVGNNDNSPMSPVLASGITGAAPIWNRIMTHLLADKPNTPYPQPDDVVSVPCGGRIEYFIKGTESQAHCRFQFSPTRSFTNNQEQQREERL